MVSRLWFLLCLGMVSMASASWAQTPEHMGMLRDVVLMGQQPDGPWVGSVAGEQYVLQNDRDPGSIHYAYGHGLALPERLNLSVTVQVTGESPADGGLVTGAGLLYAFEEAPLSYYALVLSGDGTLRLLQRSRAGLIEVDAITISPFDPAMPHRLRLIEYAEGFSAFVDERDGIDVYSPAVGTGTVGIVAVGAGRFAFQDFSVTEVRGLFVSAQQAGPGSGGHGVESQD